MQALFFVWLKLLLIFGAWILDSNITHFVTLFKCTYLYLKLNGIQQQHKLFISLSVVFLNYSKIFISWEILFPKIFVFSRQFSQPDPSDRRVVLCSQKEVSPGRRLLFFNVPWSWHKITKVENDNVYIVVEPELLHKILKI